MSLLDDLTRAIGDLGQAAARAQAQKLAGWAQVAHELGAPFGGSTSRGIAFESHGVAGHLRTRTSTRTNSQGRRSTTRSTHFRAAYALGAGPRFTVTQDGGGTLGRGLRDLLGLQDLVLGGDERFDRMFVVQTQQLPWVQQAWTPTAKERRLWDPAGTVRSDGHHVAFRVSGHVHDVQRIRNAVALVIELARVNAQWMEHVRDLVGEDARAFGARGPWNQRVPPSVQAGPSSPVYVTPFAYDYTLGLRALCAPARPLPFFDTAFKGARTRRALREDVLEGRALDLLRALGAGRLYYRGGQVEVHFGAPFDRVRVRAACDLVERIAVGGATPPTSAYR